MKPVTFLEALQYAQQRQIVLPDEFYSMDLNTRQMASTVSFLAGIDQIETVMNAVNKALANGSTFADFKKEVVDSGITLSNAHLDNVFRTNIQSAYAHGKYQQHQRNKANRPYLMYSAINDSRVRPSHLALDRVVRPIDDSFWNTHYVPLGYRCRCTIIALTEKQAEKYGITADVDLPDVQADEGWDFSPANFGDLSNVVDRKIANSSLDMQQLLEAKEVIKAEWTASKKLNSLLAPMTDSSRDLFNTIAETVIPLDPQIRPSAIRTFVDYVQGNDTALSTYVRSASLSLADDVLKRWIKEDMAMIQAVASNTAAAVTGSATIAQVITYQVGQTITLDTPLLMASGGGEIVIEIVNAKGMGIDLDKLNAGQGVLFPMGISFEIISIETVKGQLVYTLRALKN